MVKRVYVFPSIMPALILIGVVLLWTIPQYILSDGQTNDNQSIECEALGDNVNSPTGVVIYAGTCGVLIYGNRYVYGGCLPANLNTTSEVPSEMTQFIFTKDLHSGEEGAKIKVEELRKQGFEAVLTDVGVVRSIYGFTRPECPLYQK